MVIVREPNPQTDSNEEVECPECGQECSGRSALSGHLGKAHNSGGGDGSSPPYVSERQIHKKIATEMKMLSVLNAGKSVLGGGG